MDIHVVAPGETVRAIAARYGVSPQQIILNNQLEQPDRLVPGQTLVVQYPAQTHRVSPGETLYSISRRYNVSVSRLLRNNPQIADSALIFPGQELIIRLHTDPLGTLAVNGYTYPHIDPATLRKTLPFLTYLTIFTYGIRPSGELVMQDDEELIALARAYGVAPLMLISTLGENGQFSNTLSTLVLTDQAVQDTLIDAILLNLRTKNYYGLDVDFEYVLSEEREAYIRFLEKLGSRLRHAGFSLFVALAPKTSADQPGLLYEAHDYGGLGAAADYVLLMTYEWGYTYGPPMAVAPLNKVGRVVDYAVTEIPPDKLFLGIPNYGYNWTLPFVQGVSKASSLSNTAAVELAWAQGAAIGFDPTAQAPFFRYTAQDGQRHEVWFEDAHSVRAKYALAEETGFEGVSVWNIMRYFPQMWLVLNNLYNIRKYL